MKRILLMGNPNVGKSVIFSRLTGVHVIASNYPGTTVEFTKGHMTINGEVAELIDVPGSYTMEPTSTAEEVAVKMLQQGDAVINVVDATNLERSLYLTLELLERQVPVIVALNLWDAARHTGIAIDVEKLEKLIGAPAIPTVAVTGEGMRKLVARLSEATSSNPTHATSRTREQRWADIGQIVSQVQKVTHRHHTFLETLEDLSVNPVAGLVIAVVVICLAFQLIRFIGESLISYVFDPLFEGLYAPLITKLSLLLGSGGFFHDILVGKLVEGKIDFLESLGLLTTGLYVPIAAVLPYIFSFYLVLSFLEDLGYLPRLAVLIDNVMHKVGLHGYAIIPTILGLGCNVPAALATRILESRRERLIAATLTAIAVPCTAQIAVITGLVGRHGAQYLAYVFGTLALVWLILGLLLNRILKGISPTLMMEVPPYRLPHYRALGKKLWVRIFHFLRQAVPFVLLGVLFMSALYSLGVIDFIGKLVGPVIVQVMGLPKEAVAALIMGFLRKDIAVALLAPLNLSIKQLVIGSTILAIYFPCIATFIVLIKELGILHMLKAAGIMIVTAIAVGALLNLIL